MSSLLQQIDDAKSVPEVVSIVRDHLATWTPEEMGRLPAPCRPGKIRDEKDIVELHGRLVDEYRMTRASGDALTTLQRLTSLMVRTSVRIAELGGNTTATASTTEPKRSGASRG
jgi:hypothetical protein